MNPNGRCTIVVRGYLVWKLSCCFSLQNDIDWNTRSQFPPVTSIVRLTHWGRVTHICINKLTTISSDNGLSPDRRQAIIYLNQCWNIVNFIWYLGTKFNEISIEIHIFTFKKMHWNCEMSAIFSQPQCVKSIWNGDSHHQDKTVIKPSCLYYWTSYSIMTPSVAEMTTRKLQKYPTYSVNHLLCV